MTRMIMIRLALVVAGVVVWGYAYQADSARLRIAGMVLLVIALLLRFVRDDETPRGSA